MILGIVGSEGAKFTPETERLSRVEIAGQIWNHRATKVVSGGCHLGGIDIWSIEIAKALNLPYEEFMPAFRTWQSFKRRNIQIAEASDKVICLTVSDLPPGFREGGWERYCYHCGTDSHIKSGGCWTVKYAREKLHKPGEIIVI